jgi:glycosyltransferase involved in cell wall biosynthesis
MNILFIAPHPFYQQRGTPMAVRLMLESLSKRGHTIDVATFPEGEEVTIARVKIHRVKKLPGIKSVPIGFSAAKVLYDLALLPKLMALLRRNHYDLIHAVEDGVVLACLIKWLYGIPFVYDMDSSMVTQLLDKRKWLRPARPILDFFESFGVRQSLGVLAVCEALTQKVRQYAPQKKVQTLEDVPIMEAAEPGLPASLKSELGIDGALIMYVGNLERYQGLDLLLKSFALVVRASPQARLVIIGGTAPDIAHYRLRAEREAIAASVFFLGPKPAIDLQYYLRAADILVSPRIEGENTPMKIYSYLYSGKPVIATRLFTHTQVLDDEIALLVAPQADDFAQGILKLIEHPARGREIGARARQRVEERYSLIAYERKLTDFYDEIAQTVNHARDRS